MLSKRYFIKTFGCQVNHSDSERIAGFLEKNKYTLASNINEANLIIFNTCGVRQSAENRVYGQIHNIRKQESKIKNQELIKMIILTGCLANRKDVQRRLKNKVDLFFPINEFEKFENWIIGNLLEIPARQTITNYYNYLSIVPKYTNSHQAYVPVMTGCNNFCTYCVVPYARGREISRPAEEIILEIKNLIASGCKEIILLGQNVNSYCLNDKNLSAKETNKSQNIVNFPRLLKLIEKIPGEFWISFVSSHPKDYSDELIETIAKSKKICEHIHLPIQAGDDKVLARMNRKYTQKHYLNLVQKIKSAFKKHKPDILYSITSDIIVGFPGETKKQFLESARVMEKVKYDMVYFGQFSPRPGTVAHRIKDNVSKVEKERREKFLNEILKKTISANNKKYVGKIMEVLIDKAESKTLKHPTSKLDAPETKLQKYIYFGRTRTMKNVKIVSKRKKMVGQTAKVKITKSNIWNLEGELK